MANVKETSSFFTHGNARQYEFVLSLYPQALKLKAQEKNKKPEELMKLDAWYQEELPKKISARGKDAHLTHDELVQCMKWKMTRGKFYAQMTNLVKINTPKAVATETRKALRKLPNLESALNNLSSLKGVGTTMATAVLAAAAPEIAPFMADECLMSIPGIEGIDYSAKEYLKYVQHIRTVVDRLNAECPNTTTQWNPHRVELALWSHYVTRKHDPSLLDDIPDCDDATSTKENGNSEKEKSTNGSENLVSDDKDSEDSSGPIVAGTEDSSEATNDSLSVVINSEETSREPPTNGNDNTNDTATLPAKSNGATAEDDAAAEESGPTSKKIRLEVDEGAA